jgi:hypothetical protein
MNGKTYYKVYFICWLPDSFGNITTELDDRTERTKYFDTKEDAIEYIEETKSWQKEWLATIELKKIVETDESI